MKEKPDTKIFQFSKNLESVISATSVQPSNVAQMVRVLHCYRRGLGCEFRNGLIYFVYQTVTFIHNVIVYSVNVEWLS